jgi:hypothetical protein
MGSRVPFISICPLGTDPHVQRPPLRSCTTFLLPELFSHLFPNSPPTYTGWDRADRMKRTSTIITSEVLIYTSGHIAKALPAIKKSPEVHAARLQGLKLSIYITIITI